MKVTLAVSCFGNTERLPSYWIFKKKKKVCVAKPSWLLYTWITARRYIRIKVGSSYHTIFDYFWNTFTGAPNKFRHHLRSFFLNIPGNAAHRNCSLSICLMSLGGRGSVFFFVLFFAFAFIIKERMIHKSTRLLIHPPPPNPPFACVNDAPGCT